MMKKKDISTELKKLNIPFELENGFYYLWKDTLREFPYTSRKVWRLINAYNNNTQPYKRDAKLYGSERSSVRNNLKNEEYERAEVREGKENLRNWD